MLNKKSKGFWLPELSYQSSSVNIDVLVLELSYIVNKGLSITFAL